MADPFSVFSATLGILDVSERISAKVVDLFCNWKDAPILILALSSETTELNNVMDRIREAEQTVRGYCMQQDMGFVFALDAQLRKARCYLEALETLVDDLKRGTSIVRRNKWLLKKSTAAKLQTQLRDIRLRIHELLTAHNV
jgi:hypothetical protein